MSASALAELVANPSAQAPPPTMGELLSKHASKLLEVVPRLAGDQRWTAPRTRGLALLLLQQLTLDHGQRGGSGGGGGGSALAQHTSSSFCALPSVIMVPHQRSVTRALLKPLDDRNRHVRRLASALRNEWAVLGV